MLIAQGHSMRSIMRPDIFLHFIWPTIVSALLWTTVAVFSRDAAANARSGEYGSRIS
jgi:hypothetical protein